MPEQPTGGQNLAATMVENDLTATLMEGTMELQFAPGKIKITGFRLYSIAMLILTAFVLANLVNVGLAWKAGQPVNLADLKELALLVVGFIFGKKT